jgi:large subunit ribosomal protein L3
MGGVNLTVKNLKVIAVDPEQNVLLVRGAVPGPTNGLVYVLKRED